MVKGERVHFHNGMVRTIRRDGVLPSDGRRRRRGAYEGVRVRGFVRGELVDALTGEVQRGDWHENAIVGYGQAMIARNYAGLQSSVSNSSATNINELALARYWGVGYHTLASADWTNATRIQTEYAISTSQTTGNRAHITQGSSVAVSSVTTTWAATWSNTIAYASSSISHGASINCVAFYDVIGQGAGTAWSYATFASSSNGTNQALNLTYSWVAQT